MGSKHTPCPRLAALPPAQPLCPDQLAQPKPGSTPLVFRVGAPQADPLSSIFTPEALAVSIYITPQLEFLVIS